VAKGHQPRCFYKPPVWDVQRKEESTECESRLASQAQHPGALAALSYRAPCFSLASIRSVIEENRRLVAHISVSSLLLFPFARTLANSLN
jgi:hypothetical protein